MAPFRLPTNSCDVIRNNNNNVTYSASLVVSTLEGWKKMWWYSCWRPFEPWPIPAFCDMSTVVKRSKRSFTSALFDNDANTFLLLAWWRQKAFRSYISFHMSMHTELMRERKGKKRIKNKKTKRKSNQSRRERKEKKRKRKIWTEKSQVRDPFNLLRCVTANGGRRKRYRRPGITKRQNKTQNKKIQKKNVVHIYRVVPDSLFPF